MKVTAFIADDEPISRAGLRALIASTEWTEVVGEAANGPDAVRAIDTLRPELVFLDVRMPGSSGIDVLKAVAHRPHVVFTTAYAEHAATAFELGALDYLLKPFGAERFAAAMERVRAAFGEPVSVPAVDRMTEALAAGPMSRIFVRSGRTIIPVAVQSVRWFEALGDYAVAHAGSARHVLHLPMNRLEARLDPTKFVRIHRAHIVNLDHVAAFRREASGNLVAELTDGTRLRVSRAKAQELRSLAV